MKTKAIYYHAGRPVRVAAAQRLADAIEPARFVVEIVHRGQARTPITEAEAAGDRSVPALVIV